MPTIRVPQPEGDIGVFDGVRQYVYPIKRGGEITVPEKHVDAVLSSIPGSAIKDAPAAPAPAPIPAATE